MEKDGAYHVAATDDGQPVRLSEDYFIATDKAMPPQIAIDRPGGDYRASPIEEVTVGVKAADEFGLHDMHLHYSVNGGADHDVSLLQTPGAKERRWLLHAAARRFQARARRPGQRLRHRERWPQRSPHRHFFHPGRPFRARILAVAAEWRRGRRRRRQQQSDRNLQAREGADRRHLEATKRQDRNAQRLQPRKASSFPTRNRSFATRSTRFPFACRAATSPQPTRSSPTSTRTCRMPLRQWVPRPTS